MKIHFAECLVMTLGKEDFAECLLRSTRQRSLFAECQPSALGRPLTALCREPRLPSALHSANLSLPSAYLLALGKGRCSCDTRQSRLCRVPDKRHSAKNTTLGKASDSGSVCKFIQHRVCDCKNI
jgi:hypothetical protein